MINGGSKLSRSSAAPDRQPAHALIGYFLVMNVRRSDIARYFRRPRRGLERLVDPLAYLAVLLTIAVLALKGVHAPQVFPLGMDLQRLLPVLGDVLLNLSLAYLVTWLFNLLAIELPKRAEGARVADSMMPELAELAANGAWMLKAVGAVGPSFAGEPDWIAVERRLQGIRPSEPMSGFGGGSDAEWVTSQRAQIDTWTLGMRNADRTAASLTYAYPFLPSEVVRALRHLSRVQLRLSADVSTHSWARNQFENLSWLTCPLKAYWVACCDLEAAVTEMCTRFGLDHWVRLLNIERELAAPGEAGGQQAGSLVVGVSVGNVGEHVGEGG